MKTIDQAGTCERVASELGPRVSIYAPGGLLSRIHALLPEAERQLKLQNCHPDTIRDLLAPLRRGGFEPGLRPHRTQGFAVFLAQGFYRLYAVAFPVPQLVEVAEHFFLAPLFRVSQADQPFILLSLAPEGVRLFEGASGTVEELHGAAFPAPPDASSAAAERSGVSFRERVARWFGYHGGDGDNPPMAEWFQRIDEVLRTRFAAGSDAVVLVGSRDLCGLFRRVSRYPHLLDGEVHDSPDNMAAEDLWLCGWKIASSYHQVTRQRIADEYLRLWHTPRASNDLRDIEAAARQGRIHTLFLGVRPLDEVPPSFRRRQCRPEFFLEARDALELAALDTFMTGGTVYAVPPEQVPGRSAAAAVFRY